MLLYGPAPSPIRPRPNHVVPPTAAPYLHAQAWGELVDPARHHPAVEVKGATYTALRVARENGEWVAQTVVDV